MRRTHVLALSVALLGTAAVAAVVGGEPADNDPGNPELISAVAESTTTTLDLEVSVDEVRAIVLSGVEEALTEEAVERSSTTTSSTTSTTVAPKPTAKTSKKSSPTTTAPPAQPQGGIDAACESDFRGRVNSLRASNGLSSLSSNGSLKSRARSWAQRMAEAGSLSHSNISSLIPPWVAAGENVGMGGSVGSIFSSLTASGGHLHNMVGDWTDLGVGCWADGSGVLWTTHVFAR